MAATQAVGAVAAAPGGQAPAAAAADDGGWMGTLQQAVRTLALLMLFQNLAKTFLPASSSSGSKPHMTPSSSSSSLSQGSGYYGNAHARGGPYRGVLHPLWREHTPMVRVRCHGPIRGPIQSIKSCTYQWLVVAAHRYRFEAPFPSRSID